MSEGRVHCMPLHLWGLPTLLTVLSLTTSPISFTYHNLHDLSAVCLKEEGGGGWES